MKIKNYTRKYLLFTAVFSIVSIYTQAQTRSSNANYPGVVEFSSSNSTNGELVYEVMPGPSVINPAMNPTPFSDSIKMSVGSYSITLADIDSVDSPTSKDSVTSVNILFTGDNGTKYKIDKIMIIHKPAGAGDHTFYGGIGHNKLMHGNTTIGTGLMPKMTAYITLWGLVDLKNATNDSVIASNRIIHMMVATNVRDANLKMDTNVVTDGSDYNIKNAHTHIILPPLDMAGNMSPVPGTAHGFLHMMFEKPQLTNGNKDWTKVYEVLPGPAVMNPAMSPTPFSNNISIGAGTYSLDVLDVDTVDSPNSKDSVLSVNIKFQRPNGEMFMVDKIMIIHKPDGAGDHTFYGGVGFDKLMHGDTKIGTGLMPKMSSYITLWGIVDLKDGSGNILASNRVIHLMVATRVRRSDLTMIASGVIDSSDYSPLMRETHVILPPLDMAGNPSMVPGTRHGFLHLMYENVSLIESGLSIEDFTVSDPQVKIYPNPFSEYTTIEYKIERKSDVQLTIYNSNGSIVRKLVNETQSTGTYRIDFNDVQNLASGLYFYDISLNGKHVVGKLSLIK